MNAPRIPLRPRAAAKGATRLRAYAISLKPAPSGPAGPPSPPGAAPNPYGYFRFGGPMLEAFGPRARG